MLIDRKVEYSLLFVIVILVLSAYSNSLYAPFILDDMHSFVNEPLVRGFTFSWEGVLALGKSRFGWARFLPILSLAVDLQWGSGSLIAFHITNVIIHILTTLALFFLLKSFFMFISYDLRCLPKEWRSATSIILLFTVGLWALNPVQTNAVTYLVQRMTAMAALFYFLALGCYLRGRFMHLRESFNRKTLIWYLLTLVFSICSFMSKENSATLPVVILLIEFLFVSHGSLAQFARKYKVLLLLLIIFSPLICYKLYTYMGGYSTRHFTLLERLLTESRVVSSYIFLLLLPLPRFLNLEHDPVLSSSLFEPFTTFTSLLFLLMIVVYAWRVRKHYPVITFAVGWFFINLLIESSILPLELKFEHRLYLPSVGFYLILVLLMCRFFSRFFSETSDKHNLKILFIVSVVILLSGLSLLTFKRNMVWQDQVTLYNDCMLKSPNKPRAHSNMGACLTKAGRAEEAIIACEKAISLGVDGYEEFWVSASNLIVNISSLGENQRAIVRAEALLADASPKAKMNSYPTFLHNLGKIYVEESEYQKAWDIYMQGFSIASKNRIADRRWWKSFEGRFANDLYSLFMICEEQQVRLNIDGLTEAYVESSACDKMAKICYDFNKLELSTIYCGMSVKKNGFLSSECSSIKEMIEKKKILNSVQSRKGMIKTKYFYNPLACKFNFYMAAVYGLEKIGLSDSYFVGYFLRLAAALQPDNPDVMLLRSWSYYKKSRFDDAINEVDKAMELDSNYAQLWINRGLYGIGADRNEDALDAFIKAKELYPGNPKNARLNAMIADVKLIISSNSQEDNHE